MKTLAQEADLKEMLGRIDALEASDGAVWGRMNVTQMCCHLADSMRVALGEVRVSGSANWIGRVVVKPAALYLPLKWKRGLPTMPEVDQCRINRPAMDFEEQRLLVRQLMTRMPSTELSGRSHPFFGPLRQDEWLRWGWLHADHHLRQFGR